MTDIGMDVIRQRLEGTAEAAGRLWPGKAAKHIGAECERLIELSHLVGCIELGAAVRDLRAAEGFPGSLRAWTWFDDRLFALAAALDCTPTVARSTIPDRARLREAV